MKVYFFDEGLIESAYLYHMENPPYRLFFSISGVYPYVKYEEELQKINDYCLVLLNLLKEKLEEEIARSNGRYELKMTCKKINPPSDEELRKLLHTDATQYSGIDTWEFLSQDVNKGMLLTLLLAYLESSLDEIVSWFCEKTSIPRGKKAKNIGEIEYHLQKIGECCGCDLLKENLAATAEYIKELKKIRNQFIHQDWDRHGRFDDAFRLCELFGAVSFILEQTEKAACDAGILTEWEFPDMTVTAGK